MKSRFDALTRAADRRSPALVRSSGAVAVVLCLLAFNAFRAEATGTQDAAHGDLFGMEIGLPQEALGNPPAIPEKHDTARDHAALVSVATGDEFALSPHHSVEPIGY